MRIGAALPHFGTSTGPDTIVRAAQLAEKLGYDNLWTAERLLYPVDPRSPYFGHLRLRENLALQRTDSKTLNAMSFLYQILSERVAEWRSSYYPCDDYPAIREILEFAIEDRPNGNPPDFRRTQK